MSDIEQRIKRLESRQGMDQHKAEPRDFFNDILERLEYIETILANVFGSHVLVNGQFVDLAQLDENKPKPMELGRQLEVDDLANSNE